MRLAIAAVAVALLAGCSGDGGSESRPSFGQRLREGADCAELFDLRNREDPDSPLIVRMNEQLREIGCFSSGSERTDGAGE